MLSLQRFVNKRLAKVMVRLRRTMQTRAQAKLPELQEELTAAQQALYKKIIEADASGNGSQKKTTPKMKLLFGLGGFTLGLLGMSFLKTSCFNQKDIQIFSILAECAKKAKAKDAVKEKEAEAPKETEKATCVRPDDCPSTDCLHCLDKEEDLIVNANRELEKSLKDVKGKMVEFTECALKALCEAEVDVKAFMDTLYCAIEKNNMSCEEYEEIWCEVRKVAVRRCEKMKDALCKASIAEELQCRLRVLIENGKCCKYVECNPLLLVAEEALQCAERALCNARTKLECVESDSPLVCQYKDVVNDFKCSLRSEVLASGECIEGCDECFLITELAYKKVLKAQNDMAKTMVCLDKVPEAFDETSC